MLVSVKGSSEGGKSALDSFSQNRPPSGFSFNRPIKRPPSFRDLGSGWTEEVGGGTFTTYYLVEKYRHMLVVRLSDEETLKFKMDVNPRSSVLYPIEDHMTLTVSWAPVEGTQASITALDGISSVMLHGGMLLEYGAVKGSEGVKGEGVKSALDSFSQNRPPCCSIGPSVSFDRFGASAFVALAYWDLVRIDHI